MLSLEGEALCEPLTYIKKKVYGQEQIKFPREDYFKLS